MKCFQQVSLMFIYFRVSEGAMENWLSWRRMLTSSSTLCLLLRAQAVAPAPLRTWVEGTQLTMEVSDSDSVAVNVAVFKKGLVYVPLVANKLNRKRPLFACSFESGETGRSKLKPLILDWVSGNSDSALTDFWLLPSSETIESRLKCSFWKEWIVHLSLILLTDNQVHIYYIVFTRKWNICLLIVLISYYWWQINCRVNRFWCAVNEKWELLI